MPRAERVAISPLRFHSICEFLLTTLSLEQCLSLFPSFPPRIISQEKSLYLDVDCLELSCLYFHHLLLSSICFEDSITAPSLSQKRRYLVYYLWVSTLIFFSSHPFVPAFFDILFLAILFSPRLPSTFSLIV